MATLHTFNGPTEHSVVSHDEWLNARKAFLLEEKKFTKLRDELNEQRRALPWEKVEKEYIFDTQSGKKTLADLFDGKRQLIVWHFMFGPNDSEGCSHCSLWADTFNGNIVHLRQRDTTMIAISRTTLGKIEAFKARMGWGFTWVSSGNTDFNFDYNASFRPEELAAGKAIYNYQEIAPHGSELHGISTFYKDDKGDIYHTYSTYGRGVDMQNGTYQFLDLTAKGRDEDFSSDHPSSWVRHHDKYPDTDRSVKPVSIGLS
ncbi:MAG TPA: thioredoxin family protein [Candidatus Kapabacteria bacterium]|nr:thioredoxin family protein [Candidatus Kapabacteria bacterium]